MDRTDIVRTYPREAAGWVDGTYVWRVSEERPAPSAPGGLAVRARRLAEESEALNGDANTIARATYYEGTVVRLTSLAARDWHLVLELVGAAEDQRLAVVANGVARARLSLAAGARRTVELDVPLDRRELELTLVPAEGADDATTAWSDLTLASLVCTPVEHEPARSPRILIAADSTVQTYFDEERPQSGWGEWLYWYLYEGHVATVSHDDTSAVRQARVFEGNGPTIYNKALGGRAFRSYAAEHRFEKLLEVLRPGDAVLIAFGINDTSKTRPMRYASPEDFAVWVDRYVASVADRGATPVLVTTTPQYWAAGTERPATELDDYAAVARAYAAEHDVALVDLRAEALGYLQALPDEAREAIFLRADPFQYASHPDGIRDSTHLSTLGAFKYAGIVARGLAKAFPWVTLASDVTPEVPAVPGPVAPGAVRELEAENVRNNIGLSVRLRWKEPAGGADYYVVERASAETGRVYTRSVTIKPEYLSLPLPGQSRHVTYAVCAWTDGVASEPVRMSHDLPVDDDPAVELS